MVEKVLW